MQTVDNFLVNIAGKVTTLLCGITGKSNFFFARMFVWLGFLFIVAGYTIDALDEDATTRGFGVLVCILTLFMMTYQPIIYIGELEQAQNKDQQDVMIMVKSDCLLSSVPARMFFLISACVFGTIQLLAANIGVYILELGYVISIFGIYVALNYRPKKKSWVRAGAEKLAQAIRNIHLPSPLPKPIPLPVRV